MSCYGSVTLRARPFPRARASHVYLVSCALATHDLRANTCNTNFSFYSYEFLSMQNNS